jgi:hypothetical protein
VKRLLQALAVLVVVFIGAQFVRPARTNPPTDATRSLQARLGAASGAVAALNRACGDCHSNTTVWSRYAEVAPLSWAIAAGVAEGRKAVNFSDWGGYAPERQQALLAASCHEATTGKMPPSIFTALRPEARLSPQDVQAICAVAGKA